MPSIRLTTIALLFTALSPAALAQSPQEPAAPEQGMAMRTLTVSGTGEATATPDEATAQFTVLRTAETARAALDDANQAMGEVIGGMKELGIEARDLQTSGFSIAPQYRYDNDQTDGTQSPPVIVGYEVRNSLSVKSRRIDRIGEVLDKAVSLGVNQGGDISFDVADAQKPLDEARRAAVADATATAKLLAEAAGVTLGPVREISVAGAEVPPVPMDRSMKVMAASSGPAVPVEAGQNIFSADVRMVFSIVE